MQPDRVADLSEALARATALVDGLGSTSATVEIADRPSFLLARPDNDPQPIIERLASAERLTFVVGAGAQRLGRSRLDTTDVVLGLGLWGLDYDQRNVTLWGASDRVHVDLSTVIGVPHPQDDRRPARRAARELLGLDVRPDGVNWRYDESA